MAIVRYTTQEGQNLYDVALQNYGTLEELFNIFALNEGVDINTDLTALQELKIDNAIAGDQDIKGQYIRTSYVTNNADGNFIAIVDQKQFNDLVPFDFNDGTPYEFNEL